MGLHTTK